jgi:hypothetical protein
MCNTVVERPFTFLFDYDVARPIGTTMTELGRTFDEFLS